MAGDDNVDSDNNEVTAVIYNSDVVDTGNTTLVAVNSNRDEPGR